MSASAPAPVPFDKSQSSELAREAVMKTLAKIRERSKTGRLNEDSRFFRLKAKMTEMASADDVARRRAFILEHEAAPACAAPAAASADPFAADPFAEEDLGPVAEPG